MRNCIFLDFWFYILMQKQTCSHFQKNLSLSFLYVYLAIACEWMLLMLCGIGVFSVPYSAIDVHRSVILFYTYNIFKCNCLHRNYELRVFQYENTHRRPLGFFIVGSFFRSFYNLENNSINFSRTSTLIFNQACIK